MLLKNGDVHHDQACWPASAAKQHIINIVTFSY